MPLLRKKKTIDSPCAKILKPEKHFDYPLAKYARKHANSSVIFSKYGKTSNFTTGYFRIYREKNEKSRSVKIFDSLYGLRKAPLKYSSDNSDRLYQTIQARYSTVKNYLADLTKGYTQGVSPIKMWNLSIVSALIFGMFLMTFIYQYLGQRASAKDKPSETAKIEMSAEKSGQVLGEETDSRKNAQEAENYVAQILSEYQEEEKDRKNLEDEIKKMTKGYPIEKMAPLIAKQDPIVAAFLVGIARKESSWGEHVPVLNGEDCFNYWGYRGIRKRMGTGGHTCFDSREDAINTVAKRIKFLVSNEKLNTPGKMVVAWKCGYDCSWDDPKAVKKWISDVEMYFNKFNEFSD